MIEIMTPEKLSIIPKQLKTVNMDNIPITEEIIEMTFKSSFFPVAFGFC